MQKLATMCSAVAIAVAGWGLSPTQAEAHPGRCRNDSPAGECCHQERATGIVHCHEMGEGNHFYPPR